MRKPAHIITAMAKWLASSVLINFIPLGAIMYFRLAKGLDTGDGVVEEYLLFLTLYSLTSSSELLGNDKKSDFFTAIIVLMSIFYLLVGCFAAVMYGAIVGDRLIGIRSELNAVRNVILNAILLVVCVGFVHHVYIFWVSDAEKRKESGKAKSTSV